MFSAGSRQARGKYIGIAGLVSAALLAIGSALLFRSAPAPDNRAPAAGAVGAEKMRALLAGAAPGFTFRECGDCPEMAFVPAGAFRMGGKYTDENPVHDVTFAAPFAIGTTEVTFDDWDACVAARGCAHEPSDEGWGRGTRPVINVSWRDAQQYARWVSGRTGARYRLPSEAEWEYAARAGAETEYLWGDEIGANNANCSECGSSWDRKQTAPAGSFKANAWGLRDMSGNVFEWTLDCYHETYRGAPVDGSSWSAGCKEDNHVVRGGSWSFDAASVRAAYRMSYGPKRRGGFVGFRLVREAR